MFAHVIAVLNGHPAVGSVVLLSHLLPDEWVGPWIADEGRGLNAELEAVRAQLAEGPLLVRHGDLPLLSASDIDDLLGVATRVDVHDVMIKMSGIRARTSPIRVAEPA